MTIAYYNRLYLYTTRKNSKPFCRFSAVCQFCLHCAKLARLNAPLTTKSVQADCEVSTTQDPHTIDDETLNIFTSSSTRSFKQKKEKKNKKQKWYFTFNCRGDEEASASILFTLKQRRDGKKFIESFGGLFFVSIVHSLVRSCCDTATPQPILSRAHMNFNKEFFVFRSFLKNYYYCLSQQQL